MLKDGIEDSLTFDDVLFLPGHSKFTDAELKEIHVNDIFITVAAPNYPMNVKS